MFELHPTLKANTFEIGHFPCCLALLLNNSHLPWVLLVPKRAGMRELYELTSEQQQQALAESLLVSQTLMAEFKGDKLNTGIIGNLVPQLHWHHVIRYQHDPAWPQPVWGNLPAKPYTKITSQQRLAQLRTLFANAASEFNFTPSAS